MPRTIVPSIAALIVVASAFAAQAQQQSPPAGPQLPLVLLPDEPVLEPKAIDILKATSAKLAAARSMSFDALATYESPARTLQPLAYTVLSQVTLERPDKLRVISPGDGPPTEFYYDGRTITAYSPKEDLAAVEDAPPTIDEMLKMAYQKAAITFPFDDVISSDPFKNLGPSLKLAFFIGQSHVVAGTVTDMVGVANGIAQAEIWIGAEDKLPRMVRVTYFNEPGNYRHVVEFSNWHLDPVIPPGTFTSAAAAKAKRIKFASPDAALLKP